MFHPTDYSKTTITTTNGANTTITLGKLKESTLKVLSHEDIEEAGELLHNILQDALVMCEEECCAEEASVVDFVALGQALVASLINEYAISPDEKKKLQEQLAVARAEIVSLQRELGAIVQRDADKNHEKRLNSFKSRKYPPSFKESSTYSTNSNEVHSPYSNKEK
jgi:hypothetical protein